MDHDADHWIDALARSHERLAGVVAGLADEELVRPSYCSDWTVAEVLSHVGSGAEIFGLLLDAAMAGEDPPGRETFEAVWAVWNAKDPHSQAADAIGANASLVERFCALTDGERGTLRLSMFGRELDVVGLARMRLSEHALHTWDVAVVFDEEAVVAADAVALLVGTVEELAPRVGKPAGRPLRRVVVTSDPKGAFVLESAETVSVCLLEDEEGSDAVHLPSEAFVRLLYGRLDDRHAPMVPAGDVAALQELRELFPGF